MTRFTCPSVELVVVQREMNKALFSGLVTLIDFWVSRAVAFGYAFCNPHRRVVVLVW